MKNIYKSLAIFFFIIAITAIIIVLFIIKPIFMFIIISTISALFAILFIIEYERKCRIEKKKSIPDIEFDKFQINK